MTAAEANPKTYAELARIASTFRTYEKQDFLNYIWSTEFAEWDAVVSTTEAVAKATQMQRFAESVWNQEK